MIRLLDDLEVKNLTPVTLNFDNQPAIYIARNLVFHDKTKHIEINFHFTREKVLEGLIQLSYLPTRHQLADVLTKVLPSGPFMELLCKLGMTFGHSSLRGVLRLMIQLVMVKGAVQKAQSSFEASSS